MTAAFVSSYAHVKWQDIIDDKLPGASRDVRKKDLSLCSKKMPQYRSNYFTDDLSFTTALCFISRRMKIFLNVRVAWRHIKVLITRRVMGFRAGLPLGSRRSALVRESRQANENDNHSAGIRIRRGVLPSRLRAN